MNCFRLVSWSYSTLPLVEQEEIRRENRSHINNHQLFNPFYVPVVIMEYTYVVVSSMAY
ncbi:hypothetical protein ASPZODRAFT_135232, partial [Penicilliopsis zonata CBS 506.65]